MFDNMNACLVRLGYWKVPGMHVSVVNSYAAASLLVPVSLVNKVDLPTDGKPTRPTRASPAWHARASERERHDVMCMCRCVRVYELCARIICVMLVSLAFETRIIIK